MTLTAAVVNGAVVAAARLFTPPLPVRSPSAVPGSPWGGVHGALGLPPVPQGPGSDVACALAALTIVLPSGVAGSTVRRIPDLHLRRRIEPCDGSGEHVAGERRAHADGSGSTSAGTPSSAGSVSPKAKSYAGPAPGPLALLRMVSV